jgi:PTS system galactitol-specific IIA component
MEQELWYFEENLLMPLQADTKEEALTQLGTLLLNNGYVKESFIPAILAREAEYATGYLPVKSALQFLTLMQSMLISKQLCRGNSGKACSILYHG